MNQHTILQREKTTTSYASILDLFLLQIFQQFSGESPNLMMTFWLVH